MLAILVNTPESPCPWSHREACMEFLQGFTALGYTVKEVKTLEDCGGANILLLSNHATDWQWLGEMADLNPDAVHILWCYHDVIDRVPFKRWILTGEQYVDPPTLPSHAHLPAIYERHKARYVPLMLRANMDPTAIPGSRDRDCRYLACFMGSPYKAEWVRGRPGIFYHSVYEGGFLSSQARDAVYRQSLFALGFHNDANIANNHVTQRVFEGLANGCVVLSDNPAATKLTGGLVEYVATREALEERMAYFVARPEEVARKREAGYVWSRAFGTNRYAAQQFLDCAGKHGWLHQTYKRFPAPIDHVYILCHPDKEPDRYAYLQRWLTENNVDPAQVTLGTASYGSDPQFTEKTLWYPPPPTSTDNTKYPAGHFWYDPWSTQHGRRRQNFNAGNLKVGELSLIWNWAAVAHQAVQAGHQVVAIFESDVLFCEGFFDRLQEALSVLPAQVPTWDFLSLSASAGLRPRRSEDPGADVGRLWFPPLRPDHPTRCTDSMIFRVPLLAKILGTLFPCAEALDWELNFQLTLHGAAAWWLDPPVTRQGSGVPGSGSVYGTTL